MEETAESQSLELARKWVRESAGILDVQHPGWREKIDLTSLDVLCRENCPLGQVYGNYEIGLKALRLREGLLETFTQGFDVNPFGDEAWPSGDDLQTAWEEAVATVS